MDFFHDLIGQDAYEVWLTHYGVFDHEKFEDVKKFEGFIEYRGERFDFYEPLSPDTQAEKFGLTKR